MLDNNYMYKTIYVTWTLQTMSSTTVKHDIGRFGQGIVSNMPIGQICTQQVCPTKKKRNDSQVNCQELTLDILSQLLDLGYKTRKMKIRLLSHASMSKDLRIK